MENDDGDLGAVVRATYSAGGAPSTLPMMLRAGGACSIYELAFMDQDASSFDGHVNKVGFSSPPNLVSWCNSPQVVNLPTYLSNTGMGLEKEGARMGSDPFHSGDLLSFSSSMFDDLGGHENTAQLQPPMLFSSTISDKRPNGNDHGGETDYAFANAPTEASAAMNKREIGICNGPPNDQNLLENKSCNSNSIHNESESDVPSKILQYSPSTPADPWADASGDVSSSPAKHSSVVGSAITDRTGSSKSQGIKRRKTQQKRIICVPAAGGSNRPSGEGVPSDLWAWRKYGQKPIKGSPYPRGYYRCSSSKGCSARKQVERSRTDPNMLVITYTSDHNHPWPTQRNALAGTTRQSAANLEKNNGGSSEKEEFHGKVDHENSSGMQKDHDTVNAFSSTAKPSMLATAHIGSPGHEMFNDQEKAEDEEGLHLFRSDILKHSDDLFTDLGELPEPFNIFATQFTDEIDQSDDETDSTVMDPFNLFNWSSSSTYNHVESKTAR